MNCPRCGHAREPHEVECLACGVVFARTLGGGKTLPRPVPRPEPSPPQKTELAVPVWAVVVVVIVIVVIGLRITARRKAAREQGDQVKAFNAQLNEINRKGIKEMERIQKEQDSIARREREKQGSSLSGTRPSNLSDEDIVNAVQQCSAFINPERVTLPKSFSENYYRTVITRYPALFTGELNGGIAFEPPLAPEARNAGSSGYAPGREISVVSKSAFVYLYDQGDTFEVDLGRRRVTSVLEASGSVDQASARFRWGWEDANAADLMMSREDRESTVSLVMRDGSWTAIHASWRPPAGSSEKLCP